MLNTRLIEQMKPVWANAPQNYTGSANTPLYVSMQLYERILILIQTGAWAGGTAAVTLNQAVDCNGTSAKAMNIDFVWINGGTAAPDTFTKTPVVSNTFNLSAANTLYVIEAKATDLDVANGFCTMAVSIASPGSNNDFYGVTYIGAATRFDDANLPSMCSLS
jgi:hypothetical protein